MSKDELIQKLRDLAEQSRQRGADIEVIHSRADDLLIEYISDKEVKQAFDDINKWYA